MQTSVAVVRAQPVNRGGTSSYVGNPLLSQVLTADGEAATATITQANWDAGWQLFRVVTDVAVYVKLGSVATAAPRYLLMPGDVLNLMPEKAGQNVFIAAA